MTTALCDFYDLPVDQCDHCAAPAPTPGATTSLAAVRAEALSLMAQHGLTAKGWTFDFDNARRRLGVCNYTDTHISLSKHWASALPLAESRDTILHEIAHALTPFHGHDYVWAAKARAIGSNGRRCAEVGEHKLPDQAPWIGTCPTCSSTTSAYRSPQRVRACSDCCRGRFNPKHIFVWKKNGTREPMGAKYCAELDRIQDKYSKIAARLASAGL